MKARHIKRLRKRIATFKTYRIRGSASLFGDFFGYNRLGLVMDNFNVTADSHEVALKRFFRKYERMFKRRHENYTEYPCETTEKWGRLMVEDVKSGFMKFYR